MCNGNTRRGRKRERNLKKIKKTDHLFTLCVLKTTVHIWLIMSLGFMSNPINEMTL